jgi:hypothetical protein
VEVKRLKNMQLLQDMSNEFMSPEKAGHLRSWRQQTPNRGSVSVFADEDGEIITRSRTVIRTKTNMENPSEEIPSIIPS